MLHYQQSRASSAPATESDAGPATFPIKVIMAGKPTRAVEVAHGTRLRELAALIGVADPARASALLGTGDHVAAGHVLTPDDQPISFIPRLTGAQPA